MFLSKNQESQTRFYTFSLSVDSVETKVLRNNKNWWGMCGSRSWSMVSGSGSVVSGSGWTHPEEVAEDEERVLDGSVSSHYLCVFVRLCFISAAVQTCGGLRSHSSSSAVITASCQTSQTPDHGELWTPPPTGCRLHHTSNVINTFIISTTPSHKNLLWKRKWK